MTVPPLDALPLGSRWSRLSADRRGMQLRYDGDDGVVVRFVARRSAHGPLCAAYPVGAHDIEVYTANHVPTQRLTVALAELCIAAMVADPDCRRVIFAAPADNADIARAAQAAGFRHVVNVDIPGAQLSLFVAEQDWVTHSDAGCDQVPGS